ncbi:MAG: cell division protein FtsX [Bacteroidetes bacterium]|nr:cell division protein FtsX [Bacteroidota bacterium]MBT5528547.1 cell division protein FtsX [Cytophagia bacterium]MBT3421404.1 cell division protein FtsX [Bacteroidota bacterium]MBT3800193.1 cell division protein FtsX [Bacteroidota bacterium]MBT4340305.1 cell division protein FtsX [Bacteroidota bacterium]
MAEKKVKRKRASYFSPLVSITLVLFLIGLFGMLVFYADQLKDYLKENLQVNVFFIDDAKEADILRLQNMLDNETFVKATNYVDKEAAKILMTEELGEDAHEVLGFNPFPASLDVHVHANYAQVDSLSIFKENIEIFPFVKEVSYQKVILENIDKYVRIGGLAILGFTTIFFLIALILINNTIRLTLYSKRFLIKSMQLVGGTKGFIRKPFIYKAVTYGFIGGVIANLMLAGFIYAFSNWLPFTIMGNLINNLILSGSLLVLGVFLTFISSYYSVRKYLRTKLDDLY